MRLWMNEPGLRESWPGTLHSGATIARWTGEPDGLPVEECARKGIEALAGLLISGDALDISDSPDEMFCACVELYHATTATGGETGDYIGVYFRVVEFKDATYPMVGKRSFKMLIQPLSNGSVIARWNAIDPCPGAVSLHGRRADDRRCQHPLQRLQTAYPRHSPGAGRGRRQFAIVPGSERPGGGLADMAALRSHDGRWQLCSQRRCSGRDLHHGVSSHGRSNQLALPCARPSSRAGCGCKRFEAHRVKIGQLFSTPVPGPPAGERQVKPTPLSKSAYAGGSHVQSPR